MTAPYTLTVNGEERPVVDGLLTESLLHVLRERLALPGAKAGCEQGECGSCAVLVDGRLTCSCLVLAASVEGCEITTVEGLQPDDRGAFTLVQQAFIDEGAVQCGFCTPGLILAVHDLLDRNDVLDRRDGRTGLEVREALSGNLCRCTGYGRVLAAVDAACVSIRSRA